MTDEQQKNFQKMATDIALLKQFNETVIEPNLRNINNSLSAMDYVSKEELKQHCLDASEVYVKKVSFTKMETKVKLMLWVVGVVAVAVIGQLVSNFFPRS